MESVRLDSCFDSDDSSEWASEKKESVIGLQEATLARNISDNYPFFKGQTLNPLQSVPVTGMMKGENQVSIFSTTKPGQAAQLLLQPLKSFDNRSDAPVERRDRVKINLNNLDFGF